MHRIGFRYGLVLLLTGIFFTGINIAFMYFADRYIPAILIGGIAFAIYSLYHFVFPGPRVEKLPPVKEWGVTLFKAASSWQKIICILWGIVSLVAAILGWLWFDPGFFQK